MTDYGDDPVMKLYEAEKHGTPKPDPHAEVLERIAAALELIAERMTLR